ncbi:MAG TPA: sarcosine oxidase subunit gamma family protein [Bauldia sp.]|nr:sarcosine oxidase subunit gamma family protein [Bauldia sp.]
MARVTVVALPAFTRFIVRGSAKAAAAIGGAFGIALPVEACRAAGDGERSALWLGPDEWLLLAPEGEGTDLFPLLQRSLGAEPASIVDISERQLGISVAGERAADVLNAFNPLDLDPAAFPVGTVTRTVFAKAEIVMWRTDIAAFHIEVWRSFAPYVLGCLEEACREYIAA